MDESKPWNHTGARTDDFFNFGFNELSWLGYCAHHQYMRETATFFNFPSPPPYPAYLHVQPPMPPIPAFAAVPVPKTMTKVKEEAVQVPEPMQASARVPPTDPRRVGKRVSFTHWSRLGRVSQPRGKDRTQSAPTTHSRGRGRKRWPERTREHGRALNHQLWRELEQGGVRRHEHGRGRGRGRGRKRRGGEIQPPPPLLAYPGAAPRKQPTTGAGGNSLRFGATLGLSEDAGNTQEKRKAARKNKRHGKGD